MKHLKTTVKSSVRISDAKWFNQDTAFTNKMDKYHHAREPRT